MQFDAPDSKRANNNPTKSQIEATRYFELEFLQVAIDSYKKKQFLKSAMLSSSFIEEFYLPSSIEIIAKRQSIKFHKSYIDGASASQLIRYYYFISYDEELFELLESARKLRNKLVHNSYGSGSIEGTAHNAEESAKYNLKVLIRPIFSRLNGDIVAPSLLLYSDGWNDMRAKVIEMLDRELKN